MLKFLRAVIFKLSNMKRVAFILCAVLSVALGAEEVEIPKNWKVCNKRQSENYNECLRDAIQDAMIKLTKGSPELDLPVLDPYVTASEDLEYSNGFVSGKVVLKNVKTYGTSRVQILSVKTTASEGRHDMEVDVLFPRIFIEGDYKADGHFNDFVLGGKGLFNVSMEGIRTVWDMTGRVENDRWVVEHFRMLPEVESMKVHFDDLFNGNEAINIAARGFINEYWPIFYKELLPVSAERWDIQMTEFVNKVFSKLSYSKLFA